MPWRTTTTSRRCTPTSRSPTASWPRWTSEGSGAVFDRTGRYRYLLWRAWDQAAPGVAFVMLNPSTADARRDDPTIRACLRLARAWGFGSMRAVNLFALRTPDPRQLAGARDPVGRYNDAHLVDAASGAGLVVLAWGNHGRLAGRCDAVLAMLGPLRAMHCLGVTKTGQPRHPLYLPARTRPVRFRAACPTS